MDLCDELTKQVCYTMDFSSKTESLVSEYKIAPRPQICTLGLIHKLIKITDLEALPEKLKSKNKKY